MVSRNTYICRFLPRVARTRTADLAIEIGRALTFGGGSLLIPMVAQAREDRGDYDWKLFIGPSYVSPLGDRDIASVGNSIEASSELG